MTGKTRRADYFTRGQILKLVRLSPRQIQYWDETGLLSPRCKTKRRRYYDFANVVEFGVIDALLKDGFSTQKIRKFLSELKRLMPRDEHLLARLQILTDGVTLIFREKGAYFNMNGQGLLELDVERLYRKIRPAQSASSPRATLPRRKGTRERGTRSIQRWRAAS